MTMNTKLNTILAFILFAASAFASPVFADDTNVDKQPSTNEKPLETWPSTAESDGPTPGICASFLDPDYRLIERDDEARGETKDAGKKEKADDKDGKRKKETKQKKRRANAYTNPESTSCVV